MLSRLLSLLVLLGMILSTSAARATTPGPYLELAGSGTWLADSENQSDTGHFNATYVGGLGGGVALGYDFVDLHPAIGKGRVELEFASRRGSVDTLDFAEGRLPASGDIKITSVMFNTIADYHDNSRLVPYVSFGFGYAEVAIDQISPMGVPFVAASKDGVFACQVGAGLGVELGNHLAVDLGYRYFGSERPKFKLVDGSSFEGQVGSHNVLLGLRYKF